MTELDRIIKMLGMSQNCVVMDGIWMGYWVGINDNNKKAWHALTQRIDKNGQYVPDICLRNLEKRS